MEARPAGIIGLVALALAAAGGGSAQVELAQQPQTIPLWPERAPGAAGDEERDRPALTLYRPFGAAAVQEAAGTAVIVAPGGGYRVLAANHEGRQVANWLNAMGVTAFVLTYRLGPRYRHPVPLQDAQRAIRLVRARAQEFGVLPDRVGMMGFSAGGHLTATAGTRFDGGKADAADPIERAGCRPDFLVLGYPVISFTAPFAHRGSAAILLGDNPDPKMLEELSNELHVTPQTPPVFLFHTAADTAVPPENSLAFYMALRKAGVPAELHLFEKGPHGVGLGGHDPALAHWPVLLANWLRGRGLLTRRTAAS